MCASGLKGVDSQSLELVYFFANKTRQAGARVSFEEALAVPKIPMYGFLNRFFRRQAVSDDATVKEVPARVG